jgi:hypothetical protein
MKEVIAQARDSHPSDHVCYAVFPPQQVPFRERIVDKLADLLIAAAEVVDAANASGADRFNSEECLAARQAARDEITESRLSVIALSHGQRVVTNLMTLVEIAPRREAPSVFDQAIATRVAGAAAVIFESVNLLMQEITD